MLSLTWLVAGRARGGRARLIGTAAGIAVGVALLLLIVGAYQGLVERGERSTWVHLTTGSSASPFQGGSIPGADEDGPLGDQLGDDEVLVASTSAVGAAADYFAGAPIVRVDVAATPGSTVSVPGIGRPPAPGEYFASQALADLIAAHPAELLGDRYGTPAGIIGEDALASPDSLVVVVGGQPEEVAAKPFATRLAQFQGFAYASDTYRAIAIVGGIGVLFPVIVLIGIVTRLGQAARAERFATMRLLGATPNRVAGIAAFEMGATGLAGAVLGAGLYWLLLPLAAQVPIEEGRFFSSDLQVHPLVLGVVTVGVSLVAAVVAYASSRRAGFGPLGASRERRERPPRAIALLPLLAGLTVVVTVSILSAAKVSVPRADLILIGGFVLICAGLLQAGPVLTAWVSRLGAAGARSGAAVLAMNRIRQHPRATYRAVSGLVLAVFVVTVFAAAITTFQAEGVTAAGPDERIPENVLIAQLDYAQVSPGQDLAPLVAPLADVEGVTEAIVVSSELGDGLILPAVAAQRLGLAVPVGGGFVQVDAAYFGNGEVERPVRVEPVGADVAAGALPRMVLVVTDGAAESLERARTATIAGDLPVGSAPLTRAEAVTTGLDAWASHYAGLANLGILIATVICAVSMAVSTIAGVLDRRRVLGLLRLAGMPAPTLRRMLLAEAAVPLATAFVLSVVLGFVVAWTLLVGFTGGRRSISWPDPGYYATIAVSLALAAVAVLATFRTARQSTGLSATRFE